ncbi:D-amino acid dehydrogenase [Roseivivax isoporae LMG 25204]|uniref:D-amino acid dehydrogenase n=1 Tax=Roseivivax isoporae LMG 25204 TaxID=1449351 RepID=X7F5Z2_9RHOB|nr:FAD-dependent oxidoreductase [Roseivivax isoporae]ETX27496.1 D-amino acid dehydrogenase [Roseivivax isoporae LMG 25204]
MAERIVVVGAGIVGVTAALELRRRGAEVTVIDRTGVAAEASRGNAGAFALTDVVPLASPGTVAAAVRWLIDPRGPLAIPPAYAPRLVPWLWRFWRATAASRADAASAAQAALMARSSAALEELVARHALDHFLRRAGQLELHDSARSFAQGTGARDRAAAHGVRVVPLTSAGAIAEIQPGLAPQFTHGAYYPDWINVTDPARWTEHLAQLFLAAGGRIERAAVEALEPQAGGVRLRTASGVRDADRVVVAAGAWSHHLARTVGDRVPLETERGYNTTLPAGAFDLRLHLTFADHGFVASRIGDGVRIGGGVELAGLARPPDMRRARLFLDKARGFLPGLDASGGTEWMGFRPSTPDTLPVIGPSPRAPRILYAFGHGHLGLTQSAGTAAIMADLATGRAPGLDLAPYRPGRFAPARG